MKFSFGFSVVLTGIGAGAEILLTAGSDSSASDIFLNLCSSIGLIVVKELGGFELLLTSGLDSTALKVFIDLTSSSIGLLGVVELGNKIEFNPGRELSSSIGLFKLIGL